MQASFAIVLVGLLSSGPVVADPPAAKDVGPSLFETGRVAGTDVAGKGLRIEQNRPSRALPRETPVAAVDETESVSTSVTKIRASAFNARAPPGRGSSPRTR